MESPAPTGRRRAWINSRQWTTLEEPDPEGLLCSLPSAASIADDDVFSEGCFTGKIEDWLLACGQEACPVNSGQQSFESALKTNDDELSLGADASVLNGVSRKARLVWQRSSQDGFNQSRFSCSTPRQGLRLPSLNLGHSMASSCFSSSTWKTTSSVSEVLHLYSEDPEETLYELGFGCDEPQVTVRIPPRFFTFPSMVPGINFRLFLDSQIRRIREEDPSLTLASRFRQVQVLTAMANAFYSLYSHVSRTPLQKLATPEFSFSSSPVERIERFRSSIRSEPRSPVERLKDTVSKMCLYTGSPRGSDSTSPQPSPRKRSSLPDVVDVVLDKVKNTTSKRLDLGERSRRNSVGNDRQGKDNDESCERGNKKQTQATKIGNKICHEKHESEQMDQVDSDKINVETADVDIKSHSLRTSLGSSLSGETVIENDPLSVSCELQSCSAQSDARTADLKPVAKVTYDLICPQIVESVHQAPFCTLSHKTHTSPSICCETESTERSHPPSPKPCKQQTTVSESEEESHANVGDDDHDDASPVPCSITVTGWEEEKEEEVEENGDISPCSLSLADSCHTSPVPLVQTCRESLSEGKSRYLNPAPQQGHVSSSLQQVNSFELEEVHSAGEEDYGQTETHRITTPSGKHLYKGEVARGDSVQSDSSGYADEDVSPSSNPHSR